MSTQTPQSPGSDPLSPLSLLLLRLRDAIIARLPGKHGKEVEDFLESVILEYRCIRDSSPSTHVVNVVQYVAIMFMLSDEIVLQLVKTLDVAIQHYGKCVDTFVYYTTGHLLPGLVEPPPPITITLPPNATKEQLTRAYEEELANTREFWRKQQTKAHDDRTIVENALRKLIEDKMDDVLDNKHVPGSLEFAFKEVLSAAGKITVNKKDDEDDEDDDGDYFVDDGAVEVEKFVQACEKLCNLQEHLDALKKKQCKALERQIQDAESRLAQLE
jgi:hypothetical protein